MSNEALSALAEVVRKHKLTFDYTIDDDGIIISADGVEIFKGWLYDHQSAVELLQDAANEE